MIRILVVDDDICLRERLVGLLNSSLPATITEAGSGNAAIKLIERGHKFDLIISDHQMQDGTGSDLWNFIKESQTFVLFVFFTSSAVEGLPPRNGNFMGSIEKGRIGKLIETIAIGVCLGGGARR
jgi:CheY-like chemotaxis protein